MESFINGILALWFLLTAGSVLFVIYDVSTNTPATWVMKLAWILLMFYTGPIGLFVYLLACRQPMPGTHTEFIKPDWKQAVGSLMHCVAGDATGIIIAASLVYAFGLPNGIDLILEYLAAFVVGLLLFQALFMKEMFGSYGTAVRKTFFAEFVSMNMVMIGMFPVMLILMHLLPGADDPMKPLFWGVMSLATMVGGLTAFPINSWMVKRKVKHGMMTAPSKEAKPKDAMEGMSEHPGHQMEASMKMERTGGTMDHGGMSHDTLQMPSHNEGQGHGMPKLPFATMLGVGAGTFAALLIVLAIISIWIPIRFV